MYIQMLRLVLTYFYDSVDIFIDVGGDRIISKNVQQKKQQKIYIISKNFDGSSEM